MNVIDPYEMNADQLAYETQKGQLFFPEKMEVLSDTVRQCRVVVRIIENQFRATASRLPHIHSQAATRQDAIDRVADSYARLLSECILRGEEVPWTDDAEDAQQVDQTYVLVNIGEAMKEAAKKITPTAGKLKDLAERNAPPQEWFDEDFDDF